MKNKQIIEEVTPIIKEIEALTKKDYESQIPFVHKGFQKGVQRTATYPYRFGCELCGEAYTSKKPLEACPRCGADSFVDVHSLNKIKEKDYFIHVHLSGRDYFILQSRRCSYEYGKAFPSLCKTEYMVRDENGELGLFSEENKKIKKSLNYHYDFDKSGILHLDNGNLYLGFAKFCEFPSLLREYFSDISVSGNPHLVIADLDRLNIPDSKETTSFSWKEKIKRFTGELDANGDYCTVFDVVSEFPRTYACGKCGSHYVCNHQPSGYSSYYERNFTCEKCHSRNTEGYSYLFKPFYYAQAQVKNDCLLILFKAYEAYWRNSELNCDEKKEILMCFDENLNVSYKKNVIKGWETASPHDTDFIHQAAVFIDEEDISIINSFEPVKRTGWLEYSLENGQENLFEYFNLYSIYPDLEKFSKMRMFSAVNNLLCKNNGREEKIPKKLRPKKPLKLAKNIILQLRKDIDKNADLEDLMDVLLRDETATYEDFHYLQSIYRHVKDILRIKIPGMTLGKIAEYIRYVDDYQCCPPKEAAQLWNDYLRMMVVLEADMTDRRTVYTNSLKREHDKAARRAGLIKNKKEMEQFNEEIKNEEYTKLAYTDEDYTVMLPASASDLLEEGRKLNHCVGSYISRVAHGQTKILFIRETNKPDIPLCTMEVRDGEIIQVKGFSNHAPSNKVRLFVNRYAKQLKLAANYY